MRIDFGDAAIVLDARVVKTTREVTKCAISTDIQNKHEVPVTFEFLDPNDGFVVEVFHTDTGIAPVLKGTVEEMQRGFKAFERRYPIKLPILLLLSMVTVVAGLAIIWVFANAMNADAWKVKNVVPALLILVYAGLFVVIGGYNSFYGWRRYPKKLSMPEFQG